MDIFLKIVLAIAFCFGIQYLFMNIGNCTRGHEITFFDMLIMSVCITVVIMFKIINIW